MRTRSLILGSLFLAAPLSAQEACEKAAACCADTAVARVVEVQRALPASLTQDAAPVALVAADRGYLGVRLETSEEGMRILEVIPGSGAEAAGLQAGDRILTVAGTSTGEGAVQEVLQGLEAGEKVKITYDRGGETRKAKVTLMTLAEIEESLEEEPEEIIEVVELEEPSVVRETAEIEWIENIEQDLAEEIEALDVVAVEDGAWVALEAPASADDRGYLGVSLDPSGDALRILEVYTGSPAAEAGLQVGDVLLQFDGRKGGPEDQLEYMRGKKIGDKVQVRYGRGDDVGRTRIVLGPLSNDVAAFGFVEAAPDLETILVTPDSSELQGFTFRAADAGEEVGDLWISTTQDPEGNVRILRGEEGEHRVRLFTTREGNQIKIDAVVEGELHEHADHDEDHGHEHKDHDDDHGDHREIVFGVDAHGLPSGDIEKFVVRHGSEELRIHDDHDGDHEGRIVIKRIGNGEETVEEYSFGDSDHDGLPDHVRELLHRHMGDDGAEHEAPRRMTRRRAVDQGGRIQWTERAPAAPRREAARGQERLAELQRRVRELERRIAELERALERTAERPRERRIRWDR